MSQFSSLVLAIAAIFLSLPAIALPALAAEQATLPHPLPHKMLWAWQRPEDLSYINSKEYGVAYLACHAVLTTDSVSEHWRDQPLHVPPNTMLCPVLRIDTDRKEKPSLSPQQIERLLDIIGRIATSSKQIQIDFDALESERAFYRQLLEHIHESFPNIKVSITSLASWCLFDNWIKDLPVDETIPMLFSLGPERKKIMDYFQSKGDFLVTGCCRSLGLSLEDTSINQLMIPQAKKRIISVRYYIFTKTPWTKNKYKQVQSMLGDQ